MRTRKDIEDDVENECYDKEAGEMWRQMRAADLQLEVLLDIRDLMLERKEDNPDRELHVG